MPRSSSFRAALAGLLTAGLASLGAEAPASAAPAEDGDPLLVHIDAMDPVLPRSGDVVISGTVTNVSQDTYTRINLHAFSSEQPILESANLVTSAASDPVQAVGERVTVPGTFYTVDELAPGESAYFSDTVPVELLDMDPRVEGVYWIGIHALGDGAVPRDTIADGRARTFIPAQPRAGRSAEASIVLSVRSRVWFTDDGKVGGLDRWEKRLAEGGSLDGVLDMADSADGTPYSWLVDPAVLVALTRLERANPARSIVPDPNIPDQQPTETPAAGGDEPSTASGGWDTLAPPTSPTAEPTAQEQALATAAASWLNRFRDLVGTQPVLTLPFGDLDVSAAVRNDRTRLEQAVARSAEVMQVLRLPSRPAVSPASDLLSPEALQTVAPDTVVLLGDSAFDIPPTTPNSVVKMLGHKVLVTSTAAESGGPGPTAATDPLAMRQRLLSEAALRALDDDSAPLIITMPTVWRGADAAAFFDGLEQPWLDVVPVEQIADAPNNAVGQPASALNYTTKDQDAEIGAANFTAATRATNAATLLETVLRLQTTIEAQVRDEALVTLSEQHRTRPGIALKAVGRVEQAMKDYLGKIEIEAPGAVTLFSASGKLGATLVNNLDQPVTVEVRPTTDGELTIDGLSGERNLAPGARTVLRYDASTDKLGVHSIRFAVTSLEGAPLGSSDALTIRVARVSALVWVAMAGGALVLFGMIGYRLPGQIRARRAELAAASHGEDAAEPEDEQAEDRDARDQSPSDVRPEPSAPAPLLPGRP